MKEALLKILDWSEVWALLIPLAVLSIKKKQPRYLKPVIIYLGIALFLNLFGDIIAAYKVKYHFPEWLQRNSFLYNIHSIVRFICFSSFFIQLKQPFLITFKKVLPYLSLVFIIINFTFFENFNDPKHLSGRLLATEAFLLLIYCLQYYIFQLNEEKELLNSGADFWVATGLSIYVVINFFVFLFYISMINTSLKLANDMWNVHNIAFIILCVFIAKGFSILKLSSKAEHIMR